MRAASTDQEPAEAAIEAMIHEEYESLIQEVREREEYHDDTA